jgi:hypothetical protein
MGLPINRHFIHKSVSYNPGQLYRTPSPYFSPPEPAWTREPGTDYLTLLTRDGMMTKGQS